MMASPPRQFKDGLYGQFARLGKALASPYRLELLDPAATATWRVTEFNAGTAETCDAAEVHVFGPFPFDVPMDRP